MAQRISYYIKTLHKIQAVRVAPQLLTCKSSSYKENERYSTHMASKGSYQVIIPSEEGDRCGDPTKAAYTQKSDPRSN